MQNMHAVRKWRFGMCRSLLVIAYLERIGGHKKHFSPTYGEKKAFHGSTKALQNMSLYKAQSTRTLRRPNDSGETLTGTQKHAHILHPMQKSCEPSVPTRNNMDSSLMDLDPSLLIGCRAQKRALQLGQKHCLAEPICGMERHNNVWNHQPGKNVQNRTTTETRTLTDQSVCFPMPHFKSTIFDCCWGTGSIVFVFVFITVAAVCGAGKDSTVATPGRYHLWVGQLLPTGKDVVFPDSCRTLKHVQLNRLHSFLVSMGLFQLIMWLDNSCYLGSPFNREYW